MQDRREALVAVGPVHGCTCWVFTAAENGACKQQVACKQGLGLADLPCMRVWLQASKHCQPIGAEKSIRVQVKQQPAYHDTGSLSERKEVSKMPGVLGQRQAPVK